MRAHSLALLYHDVTTLLVTATSNIKTCLASDYLLQKEYALRFCANFCVFPYISYLKISEPEVRAYDDSQNVN
jgi:hypothetical protein